MIRLLLASLLLASPAGAAVFSRDLFEPGDGLLTYDPVTEREWLDFKFTSGLAPDDLSEMLGQTGVLADFQLASFEDAVGLIDPMQSILAGVFGSATIRSEIDWIAMLGYVGEVRVIGPYTGGMLAGRNGKPSSLGVLFVRMGASVTDCCEPITYYVSARAVLASLDPTDQRKPLEAFEESYWLYRDAAPVPEPAGLGLALTACLAAFRLRAFA